MIKSFVLSLSIAAVGVSYAADWQHNHPQFDPTGKVTLGTLAGVTSQLSNANQQGLQSSASPTVLSVQSGLSSPIFAVLGVRTNGFYSSLVSWTFHPSVGFVSSASYSYVSANFPRQLVLESKTITINFQEDFMPQQGSVPLMCSAPVVSGLAFPLGDFQMKRAGDLCVLDFESGGLSYNVSYSVGCGQPGQQCTAATRLTIMTEDTIISSQADSLGLGLWEHGWSERLTFSVRLSYQISLEHGDLLYRLSPRLSGTPFSPVFIVAARAGSVIPLDVTLMNNIILAVPHD